MSKVLPILFNTEMVRAILDGRKTVTRRTVRPKSKYACGFYVTFRKSDNTFMGVYDYDENEMQFENSQIPPCQPGDILYVRETWGISNLDYDDKTAYIVYKASENKKNEGCRAIKLPNDKFEKLYDSMSENNQDWHPSIHMPKEAARIWLKVTDVRVERLQEMTQVDFLNEGVNTCKNCTSKDYCLGLSSARICYLKSDFIKVWDSTLKKSDLGRYGWDADPWVWVIKFERCEKPEEVKT